MSWVALILALLLAWALSDRMLLGDAFDGARRERDQLRHQLDTLDHIARDTQLELRDSATQQRLLIRALQHSLDDNTADAWAIITELRTNTTPPTGEQHA